MPPTSEPASGPESAAESATVPAGGESPAGHLVVLLHGQPGGPEIWHGVEELLADRGLHLRAVDRPGYGSSPLEAGGFRHNAVALAEMIRASGPPAIVVAHSWAAAPALLAGCLFPELIDGLVLCAPVGDPGSVTLLDRLLGRTRLGRAVLRVGLAIGGWLVTRPGGPRLLAAAGLGRLDRGEVRSATRSARDRKARRAAAIEQAALIEELVEIRRAAPSITVPTVVIAGRRDGVVSPQAATALAHSIPGARLVMVEGGHLLPLEHPTPVAEAVLQLVGQRSGLVA
jgi:pimeloyl-ACP methyl ester carboxylesterase